MFDEMYLQKGTQYQGGKMLGADEMGNLYKGIVCFMIVGLKKNVPLMVKATPECKISGKWLVEQIVPLLKDLRTVGLKVRAVVADNHSSNVSCFNKLGKKYGKQNEYFINFEGQKMYLFYDATHLVKNIRNNLFAKTKFDFTSFEFCNFLDDIKVPAGRVQWGLIHAVYDRDQTQNANLRKAHKLSYRALHPGNNKQDVPLALAVFDESTSAGMKSYFPARRDASGFLDVIRTWWLISNSKQRWHTNNYLGDAIISEDGKIDFLNAFANWVEEWSSTELSMTAQTSSALIRTTRCTAMLVQDLIAEGYDFVLTGRFQSDPLERRYGCFRMMSGGRFLVGLAEVKNSEKILILSSLIKENINFWDEDVYESTEKQDQQMSDLLDEIDMISVEVQEACLEKETREVSVAVSGYIAKKIGEKVKCDDCNPFLICQSCDEKEELDTAYLDILSRGGLTTPGKHLDEFVTHAFAILDLVDVDIAKYPELPVRLAAGKILAKYLDGRLSCPVHHEKVKRYAISHVINIFYNNKTKRDADQPRKDGIEKFKEKKRKLEEEN